MTTPLMRNPRFSRSDIEYAFEHRILARGRSYAREGRVLSVAWTGSELRGRVRGSQVYEVLITLAPDGRHTDIDAECECPYGFNCKHAAAALLVFDEQCRRGQPQENAAFENWMTRVHSLASPAQLLPAGYNVVFTLAAHQHFQRRHFYIEAWKVYVRKDGRMGRRDRLGYPGPQGSWVVDRVLNAMPGGPIDSRVPTYALGLLARSCRLYWENLDGPILSLGAERRGEVRWTHTSRGELRPQLVVEQGDDFLRTIPPWYLDLTDHSIGPVRSDCDDLMAHELLDAPALLDSQLPKVIPALVRFSQRGLPLPDGVNIDLRTDLAPRIGIRVQAPGNDSTPSVQLRLAYGEEPLEQGDPEFLIKATDAGHIAIKRKPDQERRLREQVAEVLEKPELARESTLPLAWAELGALRLDRAARLGAMGVEVQIDDEIDFEVIDDADLDFQFVDVDQDWFSLSLRFRDRELPLLELLKSLLVDGLPPDGEAVTAVAPEHGVCVRFDVARVRRIIGILGELLDERDPELRLPRSRAHELLDLDDRGEAWRRVSARMRKLVACLADGPIRSVAPPDGLKARLRDYQLEGLAWMAFLREHRFGGILADDMGLGKTVQALAHLLAEKQSGRLERPALVVAPTSLMGVWRGEARRFTPALRVLVLQGPDRPLARIPDHDLIVTSYTLLRLDAETHRKTRYGALILDEAQYVKNPRSQTAKTIREIPTEQRLCLTGTPLENHLEELWAQFDFLMPGFLGGLKHFRKAFRQPIERAGDGECLERLGRRIRPFLLRRTKDQVAAELPPKSEIVQTVTLHPAQADLYEVVRQSMEKRVRKALAEAGLKRSSITVLDALLKLRQVCCDPRLVKLASARSVKHSAKLDTLMDMVPELVEDGRRILLFSQFTEMLGLIESRLREQKITFTKLTGATRKREAAIERFTDGKVPVFLISLKAGGTGLTLTEADTVIHYDPWWNPAVERQATDRAHRIGQDKPVFVYKLIAEGTVEEKIIRLHERKQGLSDSVLAEKGATQGLLDEATIAELFAPVC